MKRIRVGTVFLTLMLSLFCAVSVNAQEVKSEEIVINITNTLETEEPSKPVSPGVTLPPTGFEFPYFGHVHAYYDKDSQEAPSFGEGNTGTVITDGGKTQSGFWGNGFPKTGDNAQIAIPVILLVSSGAVLVYFFRKRFTSREK